MCTTSHKHPPNQRAPRNQRNQQTTTILGKELFAGRDPINKLNMLLHAARRYFHDDNGLPNLEALKNIYQVVAQQLLNSRERYVKKHHNQQ